MHLPNAKNAIVERPKIEEYPLAASHPYGGPKARFLMRFGFSTDTWRLLRAALVEHAVVGDARLTRTTPHGTRWEVTGSIGMPDGRNPEIISVWQYDSGSERPRLITLIPRGGEQG